jgi:AcrR family transcriptional regulator
VSVGAIFLSGFLAWLVSIRTVPELRGEASLGLRERKKQRTRATLIDAAVDLCDRQGFDRTTVDQIAAIADVSPRTFSRYFATKDAIALALVDEVLDRTAVELARQPRELNHFEALLRAYLAMANSSKVAEAGELSADRVMCIVRILLSSPALRQAALEYRANSVDTELAKRMGVGVDDRGPKLVSAVAGSVLMTALSDLADDGREWSQLSIDDVAERLEITFAEFTGLATGNRQAV